MCEPVSIITGIISAVTAIASTATAAVAEKEAIEAQNRANVINANMAIDEANDLSKQESIAEQNEQKAAGEQSIQLKRANMQKSATARASSQAEGRVSDLVANEYIRALSNDKSVIQQNLAISKQQHNIARDMYIKSAKNQIMGLQDKKQTNAGIYVANALLQTGSAVTDATGNYYDRKNRHGLNNT